MAYFQDAVFLPNSAATYYMSMDAWYFKSQILSSYHPILMMKRQSTKC